MIAPLLALLLASLLAPSDLVEAERAYRAGRFAESLALYRNALAEPELARGPLFYDMGNCAYRLGRHAEAALYYRRALLRTPDDPKARFNLRLAERELGIEEASDAASHPGVLARIERVASAPLALLSSALQTAGLAGLVLLRRRGARWSAAFALLLGLAAAVPLVRTEWFPRPPEGVVLDGAIALRTEPDADRPPVLELRGGETVRLLEIAGGWMKVEHPEGRGWTESSGVGVVE